jgi:RNA polymerase sigma-70 factor, ECF subfamily
MVRVSAQRSPELASPASDTSVPMTPPGGAQGLRHPHQTALLRRLRAGDEAAYEQLVRQHGGAMLAVARRILRDEDAARDAVQDAFMNTFRAIGRFREDAKLSTWLHRIVVNAALMQLRRMKRRVEGSLDDLLPAFDDTGHHTTSPPTSGIAAEAALERKETRAMVRASINRLPTSYRTVLVLRDIEGLSTTEAAELLGISEEALKVRLHRARQGLTTLLSGVLAPGKRIGRETM